MPDIQKFQTYQLVPSDNKSVNVFILGKSPKGLHKIAQGNALGIMIKYL